MLGKHCVKSVQIRSFFWCVFSCIRTECRKIRMVIFFTLNFISAKISQRNIFSFLEICMAFIRLSFKLCISYVISCSKATLLAQAISAQNTVISPNLLLWKFCGKAHFRRVWANCQELCRNCVFPQNFHTRKLGDYFSFDLW